MLPPNDAPRDNPRLKAALRLARKGKPIFPCNQDKEPLTPNGFYAATTDARRLTAWWTRYPDALIGMPTGPATGVFVVDVDRLGALEEMPHDLPATFTVRTRSGGRHLYFHHVDGIRNSSGGMPEGIDIRGEGGYVIVPPSPGYEISDRSEIAPAPEWLLEKIREKPTTLSTPRDGDLPKVDLDDTSPIPAGCRNQTLASIGGRLRAYGLERDEIEASLLRVNASRCSLPLPGAEVSRIAASVSRYAPGKGSPPPDAETSARLETIEAAIWRSPWPRIGGKSERSLAVVLLKLARRHGRQVESSRRREGLSTGIEVTVSHRVLALAAATSTKSVRRIIKRSPWFEQGTPGEGRKSGSIILSTPGGRGAQKVPTLTTERV